MKRIALLFCILCVLSLSFSTHAAWPSFSKRKKPPKAGRFWFPEDVAIAKDGTLFIADDDQRIYAFDKDGKFLHTWGQRAKKQRHPVDGEFWGQVRIDLAPDGTIYTSDKRVQMFTPEGKFIKSWSVGEERALDIAAASDGTVYILKATKIQHYTADGSLIKEWGSFGGKPGQMAYPMALATAPDNSIYISEWHSGGFDNHRVQQFKPDGTFVRMWRGEDSKAKRIGCAYGITIADDGTVYVADAGEALVAKIVCGPRIHKYTAKGKFVKLWGKRGTKTGMFSKPMGMAVDAEGNVYVADSRNHRIQKFNSDGEFLWELWSGNASDQY